MRFVKSKTMETPLSSCGREFPLPTGNERWAADHGIIGYNLFYILGERK